MLPLHLAAVLLAMRGQAFAAGLIAGTALLADWDEDLALGFYHTFSGWLVFVLGFGLLYVTARLLHAIIDRQRP